MSAPKYQAPPLDPSFQPLSDQAKQDKIAAVQQNLSDYTAKLMQRYGAQVSLSGAGAPSPLSLGALMTSGRGA